MVDSRFHYEMREGTTMTPGQIIYQRRLHVLECAARLGNVSEACRRAGISRTSYYRWTRLANRRGLSALMPKDRRAPSMPNQAEPHEIEAVLAEAISRPTIGARQLAVHLGERGVVLSASGIQKILGRHRLGRRSQRVHALAQITASHDGLVSREAIHGPFGFCHFAARPGDLVALDAFYVGKLKGVGTIWQLTAVDTATRIVVAQLITEAKTAKAAVAFVDLVRKRLKKIGIELSGVLTDRGPEFHGRNFQDAMAERDISHTLTPPRSPNHNAVVERVQGVILEEFYRPAFHRQRFGSLAELDRQLQGWLSRYNTTRPNHGDFMCGRTPREVLDSHRRAESR